MARPYVPSLCGTRFPHTLFPPAEKDRACPNHKAVVDQARGELYKEAADDDLYARELLERCVEALDEYPQVVLAHCWTARVDELGDRDRGIRIPAEHRLPAGAERFRSVLFDSGGDDGYGMIRMDAPPGRDEGKLPSRGSPIVAEMACMVRSTRFRTRCLSKEISPGPSGRAAVRSRWTKINPRRANGLRHPAVRLYGEYVWALYPGRSASGAVGRGPARMLRATGAMVRQSCSPRGR